jgi:tagatose 1,6-diphosphate aldolase
MFFDTNFLKNEEMFLRLDRTADADEAKKWLPAYYFMICLMDGTEVGYCDFRIGYNENTYYGGNIGYAVNRKSGGTIMRKRHAAFCSNLLKSIKWTMSL